MNWPSFIIFKEARRFQAGHLDLAPDSKIFSNVKVFTFRGRDYHFVGQCVHYCQITDEQNKLVGFVLNHMMDDVKEPTLLSWFNDTEAGINEDDCYFFIQWPRPEKWENDCSLLIGANVYHDGHGDFLIQIDDVKSQFATRGQFQNLWSEIAFPLAPPEQFTVKGYFPKDELKSDNN
jgi:hypothetical protein